MRPKWVVAALFALGAAAGAALMAARDNPAAEHDQAPRAAAAPDEAPEPDRPTLEDHWHTAFGVYVCGSFLEARDTGRDPLGLHTHDDGIIHVHPFTAEATGSHANVGLFAKSTGAFLDDRRLEWGGQAWREGTATCDGRPGEVVVAAPDRRVTRDVGAVLLLDCSWLTIAFVAEGDEVPPPPTAGAFSGLGDVRGPSDCTKDA